MKVGSLFSGIGGIDLGLERAGMTIAWQVEIDPFCRQVLEKHWPNVPKYGDIRELRGDELEPVDLICGGFPCQPVSVAGKRRGQEDERWLWPEFARILRILRPKYVLVENVPGLLVRGMGDVLGDLAALGYDAEWDCIPAAAFGAPHLRYRVFIVAYTNSVGCAQGNLAPRIFNKACYEAKKDWERWSLGAIRGSSGRVWQAPIAAFERVDYGLPGELDRLKTLGNAVVPQVAEWIGKRILELEGERNERARNTAN